jgi:serine kinase
MPFDDSNIRKLVRYQLEKKIHFSRYKPLSNECKQLILSLLEPDIKLRANIFQIKNNDWFKGKISSINNISLIEESNINIMKNSFESLINNN